MKLDQYSGYLARDPANAGLIQKCADMHFQLAEFDKARDLLYRGLQSHPGHHAMLFLLSTVELAANQPAVAADILKSLLNNGVDNGGVRYNLAYSLALQGEMAEAKSVLDAVISSTYPEFPTTKILLARINHHLGDMEAVIQGLNEFLQDYPNNAEANGNLALAYADTEDYAGARQFAEKALSLGGNVEGYLAMGLVELEDMEPDAAMRNFSNASNMKKNSGRAWMGMGLSNMLKGDLPSGEGALEKSLQQMPKNLGTWNALAWSQIAQQKLDSAEQTLNKALEINRHFSETHGALAVVYFLRGDFENAHLYTRRAKGLDENSYAAAFAESLLMLQQGNSEKAGEMVVDIFRRPINKEGKTLESQITKFAMKRSDENRFN